jgi:uncharacterized membrane protein
MIKEDFFKCGIAGWCIEVLWTGWNSWLQHDLSLSSTTSILMFPIYGMAALIRPLSHLLDGNSVVFRGLVYTVCIFITEYTTGSILKVFHVCPWNYEDAKYNINGIIRLDYAPAWFAVGLFFEKLLNPGQRRTHAQKQQI